MLLIFLEMQLVVRLCIEAEQVLWSPWVCLCVCVCVSVCPLTGVDQTW